jgi:hypothetical protein
MGMIQVSANPFKEKNVTVNFQEVVNKVLNKYKSQ